MKEKIIIIHANLMMHLMELFHIGIFKAKAR